MLRQALDGAPPIKRDAQASGVMMIPVPGDGVLTAVHGLDEARAVPFVTDITITVARGKRLVPLPEGGEYPGFIFARGETPQAVETALREAHTALEFELDAGGSPPAQPIEDQRI